MVLENWHTFRVCQFFPYEIRYISFIDIGEKSTTNEIRERLVETTLLM